MSNSGPAVEHKEYYEVESKLHKPDAPAVEHKVAGPTVDFEEVIICPICKEPNTSHMDNWICS